MADIAEDEAAIGSDAHAAGGGKAHIALREQSLVKVEEHFGGLPRTLAIQCAENFTNHCYRSSIRWRASLCAFIFRWV